MTRRPFASPLVEVQSPGGRPQLPCSDAGIAAAGAVLAEVGCASFAGGGPPSGVGIGSLIGAGTFTATALSATGLRSVHATHHDIVTRTKRAAINLMTAQRRKTALVSPWPLSAHRRDHERLLVVGIDETVRPPLRDDLVLGPEADAFLAVLADVAEA